MRFPGAVRRTPDTCPDVPVFPVSSVVKPLGLLKDSPAGHVYHSPFLPYVRASTRRTFPQARDHFLEFMHGYACRLSVRASAGAQTRSARARERLWFGYPHDHSDAKHRSDLAGPSGAHASISRHGADSDSRSAAQTAESESTAPGGEGQAAAAGAGF